MQENAQTTPRALNALLRVRAWERAHLPLRDSIVALDIVALVGLHTVNNTPLSLKQLDLALPHSSSGIRKQLERLIEEGWLKLTTSTEDGRVRYVVAEKPLLLRLRRYSRLLLSTYGNDQTLGIGPATALS